MYVTKQGAKSDVAWTPLKRRLLLKDKTKKLQCVEIESITKHPQH
jgi:hypothetical protein